MKRDAPGRVRLMRPAGSARAARGASAHDRGLGLGLRTTTTTPYAPRIHDQARRNDRRPHARSIWWTRARTHVGTESLQLRRPE